MKQNILKILSNLNFWIEQKRKYWIHSRYYNNAGELPLKIFLEIVSTGNYSLLRKKGKPRKKDKLALVVWGELLLEYADLDGNTSIKNNFDKLVTLRQLQNSYNTIKAMIKLLSHITPDSEEHGELAKKYIEELEMMDYHIDTSNSESYSKSLIRADRKSNSLVTLIRMKANEMKGNEEEESVSFEEIMAMLQMHFHDIKEDITLKKYIACKNILKKSTGSKKGKGLQKH